MATKRSTHKTKPEIKEAANKIWLAGLGALAAVGQNLAETRRRRVMKIVICAGVDGAVRLSAAGPPPGGSYCTGMSGGGYT